MSVLYGDPNKQRRFDAFRIVDESGYNPLFEAIKAATAIEDASQRCQAWLKVAEFIYAKPKQQIEHSGAVTLESLLGQSWAEKPTGTGPTLIE